MEQNIEVNNTGKNDLDYMQNNIEEDVLNIDENKINKDNYNKATENDILETSEGTSENFYCNLDFLNVNPCEMVTQEVSQVESAELETLNSNVTLSNNFDIPTTENDRHEEILQSEKTKKRKGRKIQMNFHYEIFACTECDYTSSKERNLKVHEAVHSNKKPYKCTKCDYSSKYRSNLSWHKNKYHKEWSATQRKKKKHISTQKKGPSSVVLHYSEVLQKSSEVASLDSDVTLSNNYDVDTVESDGHEEILPSNAGKKRKLRSNSDNICNESQKQYGHFPFTKCEDTAYTRKNLENSETFCSDERPYKCTKNDYSSKFACIHCGDSFSDLNLLRKHEITSKCKGSRELEKKSSLSENQKEYHSKQEEDVSFLDSSISQPTQNYKPNKSKSIRKVFRKLYQCKLCKFSTRYQFTFMEHESFHSSTKPYTCLKCDFNFRYRSNLYRHKKICSGTKIRGIKLENKNRNKCTSRISSDKTEFHEFGNDLSHDNIFRHHQNLRKKSSQQKQNIDVTNKKRKLSLRFNRRRNLNLKLKGNAEILKFNLGSDKNSDSQKLNYNKTEEEFEKDEVKETLQKIHSDGDESNSSNESNTNLSSLRTKIIGRKLHRCKLCKFSSRIKQHLEDHENFHTGKRPFICLNCNSRFKFRTNLSRHKKRCSGTDEFGKNAKVSASNKTSSGHERILRSKETRQKSLSMSMGDHLIFSKPSQNDNLSFNESDNEEKEACMTASINNEEEDSSIHCDDSFSDLELLETHEATSERKGSREFEIKSSLFENQEKKDSKHEENVSICDSNISQPTKNYKANNKSKSSKSVCSKLYRCKLCKFSTKNKHYFVDHGNFHTGERPYTCLNCNSTFKYQANLSGHKRCCSGRDKFGKNAKVSISNKTSSGHERILRSKEIKQKSFQVAMDYNFISSKPSLNDNYTESKEEDMNEEIYNNSSDVKMDSSHSKEVDIDAELFKFFPPDSENSFEDDALIQIFFKKAKVILEKLKLYFCEKCDFVSQSSSKLETHKYETHFRSKKYECSECNYTSVTWRDLKKHEATHQKNMCEESISSPSFIIENEEISLNNNKTDANGLSEGKLQPGQSVCNISFNERDNEEKEEEEDTCVILSTDNEEEEDTCVTLSTDNEEEEDTCVTLSADNEEEKDTCVTLSTDNETVDSSITLSTSENVRVNINVVEKVLSHNSNRQSENEPQVESSFSNELFFSESNNINYDDVHSSITPSALGIIHTNMNKVKNISSQNIKDVESNYQVARKNESNKKIENVDMSNFREIIGEVFNDRVTLLLNDILGTTIAQKLLRKNPELSTNSLESEQKLKDKLLEIKRSQSDHDVDKPVDKTSYDYIKKAVELYEKSLGDSEEDEIDSNDVDLITEESPLQDLDPSIKNTGNTSELALGSLAAKSKNINLPIVRPTHLIEPSSGKPRPVIVETVPENYRMLNVHKPLPRQNINTMDKASTSVCENLASNNYVNAQELPRRHSNNFSLVNANKSFNSDSNSGRLQFPSNFNINVAVSPSSTFYSNRHLTRDASFPSMSGIAEGTNNFLRAAPEPLINQHPLLTTQISGCSPGYVNNASGLHDVTEMEGFDIPVDHVMRMPQEPGQPGKTPLDECKGKNSSLDSDFIFRCSKCNYVTNVKAFFSRHYLEVHVREKNT